MENLTPEGVSYREVVRYREQGRRETQDPDKKSNLGHPHNPGPRYRVRDGNASAAVI
jgi:hypothetical protein